MTLPAARQLDARGQNDLCLHSGTVVKSKDIGVKKLGWILAQFLLEVYTCKNGLMSVPPS